MMRIYCIATYTLFALFLSEISYAAEPDLKLNQDESHQSDLIINDDEQVEKTSQEQQPIVVNVSEQANLSSDFSEISTQAKDLKAQYIPSPLQQQPTRIFNLETANQLSEGAIKFEAGTHQATSADNLNSTGYQIYYSSVDWGATDKLQLGVVAQFFDDPTKYEIKGRRPELTVISLAPSIKYQVFKNEKLKVALSGSAELLRFSSDPGLFNNTQKKSPKYFGIGKVEIPVTYNVDSDLQLHLTPGVAFYPDKVKNADFYGTFVNVGAGVSWQTSEKLNLFANTNIPFGPGGNTLNSKDDSISRKVLWTAGTRYALNPRVGLEAYATNAFGATPTTSLLAFIPDGNEVLFGANVKYIFDSGQNYAANFGNRQNVPLSVRDTQLLLDGFTLSSASTLPPGKIRLNTGLTSGGNSRFTLAYGIANDLQVELPIEQFGGDLSSIAADNSPNSGVKLGPGAKFRFLDQTQGDPFSLSAKVLGVRDFGSRPRLGTLSVEIPVAYQPNNKTALFFNPKSAFFSAKERLGIGLGINQVISDKLQFIGEFTPVFSGNRSVWSTGLRYFEPRTNLGIDVYASNAAGQNGLGGLVADKETNVGFNVHWLFSL